KRAYCLKTQPATGETYPKSDLFNKALPIAQHLGIDPIHFGIIMVFNLTIGLCTPPVGTILFVGCSIGKVSIDRAIKPLLPMFLALFVVMAIICYFPQLSLMLPGLFST
ncbi:TRAP transporter large permease subunit, partial [Escherichia coli]|nr:TRAP transporter large permease subunit [Escherichia coli]